MNSQGSRTKGKGGGCTPSRLHATSIWSSLAWVHWVHSVMHCPQHYVMFTGEGDKECRDQSEWNNCQQNKHIQMMC